MTTTVLNTKISEVENKIADHTKYITIQEFKLMAENFKERLKQADLESKNDFDSILISFNKIFRGSIETKQSNYKRL